MDSVRDLLSCRRPLFTTWTFGRRRYYSPLVHAVAARMDHAALSGSFSGAETENRPAPTGGDDGEEGHPVAAAQGELLCT
jgi:hypothetical protein